MRRFVQKAAGKKFFFSSLIYQIYLLIIHTYWNGMEWNWNGCFVFFAAVEKERGQQNPEKNLSSKRLANHMPRQH